MTELDLNQLAQRDLVRLCQVQHGRLVRIAKLARDPSVAPWELKKGIAEELATFNERTKLVQRTAVDQQLERNQAARNERRWSLFGASR